jgi:DNA-binding Lrp family transcriptional regulator
MDDIDRTLLNRLQDGIPVCERPFDALSAALGIPVHEILSRLQAMLDRQVLSRFGPLYNAERMGGALSLCAMQVDAARFDAVAEQVNAYPEVAHNYERDHPLNMWFVIAAESPRQHRNVVSAIERDTGCTVYDMPKQTEYFLDLRLPA